MRAIRWRFALFALSETSYPGFTDDSYQGRFINVWITPEVRDAVIGNLRTSSLGILLAHQLRKRAPNASGYISLADGSFPVVEAFGPTGGTAS